MARRNPGPGTVVADTIIPAREYAGIELRTGQLMRIVDVEGKQVPDLVCFNLANPRERLSTNNSRLIEKRWLLTTGHTLYSDEGNPMLTITDDTVGVHHASAGCCNEFANFLRYGERNTRNCLDNLAMAAAPLGLTTKDIPGAFCPFMKVVQHPDGSYEIQEPDSRAGDHIDLRAEMDLFVAISNCPQDKNPCNGFNPTPLQLVVFDSAVTESVARRVLVRDARLVTADDEDRILDPGDVVIEGDRLAYVGPAAEGARHRAGPFDEEIDGRRLVVIPGLINAHTHTYATLFKGSYERMPLDLWLVAMRAPTQALSEELLHLSSLVAGIEMLKTGTTTALDHFFGNPALPGSGIRAEIMAMQSLGLRHAVASVVMDMRWEDTLPLDADALAGVRSAASDVTSRETAQAIDGAEAFIREFHRSHPLTTCLVGPSAAHRCSDGLLRRSRELADATGAGIHLHIGEAKSHAIQSREVFGESLVGRLDRLGILGPDVSMAHGVWLDDDELDRVARTGATIVHNPASNLKLGSGVARVRDMLTRGVNVAVATDGPCSSDNFNLWEGIRLAGLLHTSNQVDYRDWPSAREVFRMATRAPARAVRMEDEIGSLEAGRLADLVTLTRDSVHWAADNDPWVQLVYSENGSSIDRVFVGGREVLARGRVTTVDEISIYRAVGEARAAIDEAARESNRTITPLEQPIHDMWQSLRDREVAGVKPSAIFR